MKRIILILLFIPSLLAAQTFTIETSRGDRTLTIPENMTIEEAYQEMASLYLEERYDLEEALDNIDNLTEEVEEYVVEVEDLQEEVDTLQEENEKLNELYEKEIRTDIVSPIASVGFGIEGDTSYYGSVSVGLQFFESWFITADVSYPVRLGIGIGRTF